MNASKEGCEYALPLLAERSSPRSISYMENENADEESSMTQSAGTLERGSGRCGTGGARVVYMGKSTRLDVEDMDGGRLPTGGGGGG